MADTLSIWAKRFTDDLGAVRRYSPLTVTAYHRDLTRFLQTQKLGDSQPGDRTFSPQRFQNHLASLAADGLSNRSIARAAAVLRSFLSFLYRRGATDADWAERVPSVKFAASLPRFVGESQMRSTDHRSQKNYRAPHGIVRFPGQWGWQGVMLSNRLQNTNPLSIQTCYLPYPTTHRDLRL